MNNWKNNCQLIKLWYFVMKRNKQKIYIIVYKMKIFIKICINCMEIQIKKLEQKILIISRNKNNLY